MQPQIVLCSSKEQFQKMQKIECLQIVQNGIYMWTVYGAMNSVVCCVRVLEKPTKCREMFAKSELLPLDLAGFWRNISDLLLLVHAYKNILADTDIPCKVALQHHADSNTLSVEKAVSIISHACSCMHACIYMCVCVCVCVIATQSQWRRPFA